jgi:hypothetical protein
MGKMHVVADKSFDNTVLLYNPRPDRCTCSGRNALVHAKRFCKKQTDYIWKNATKSAVTTLARK